MSIRKLSVKVIVLLGLISSFLVAGPAISGTRTFTQPDGTKFEGILKGDSSFHWIESAGSIVIVNPEDKFYYKAIINTNNEIILSNEKPAILMNEISKSSSRVPAQHEVTQEDRKNLDTIYKKSKIGNNPQ